MTDTPLSSNEGVATPPQVSTPSPSPEKFNLKKFLQGMFSINAVTISKDIVGLFSIRKIIIYLLIAGSIYGYGYWKGLKGKPVYFDIQHKQAYIKLNGTTLHVKPDGTAEIIDTKTGKKLKDINIKDVKDLDKLLKPIGFDFRPFFTAGGSLGTTKVQGVEVGIGTSVYKLWKTHLNIWVTQAAGYIGPSYSITDNFDIVSGFGQGWKSEDKRVYLGGLWRF
jgi:hypothetical protein